MKRFLLVCSLALIGVLALTACASKPASPVEVDVTLTDFGIESSLTEFKTGVPYNFMITNNGKLNHEIMIMPPTMPGAAMSMEEMDKMALAMIEEDDMPPGSTNSLEFTFTEPAPAGTLEIACHAEGHYEAGMKLPITVK